MKIIDMMKEERIFKLKHMPDGKIRIREECDRCFEAMLSRDELITLGYEMIEFAGRVGKNKNGDEYENRNIT